MHVAIMLHITFNYVHLMARLEDMFLAFLYHLEKARSLQVSLNCVCSVSSHLGFQRVVFCKEPSISR